MACPLEFVPASGGWWCVRCEDYVSREQGCLRPDHPAHERPGVEPELEPACPQSCFYYVGAIINDQLWQCPDCKLLHGSDARSKRFRCPEGRDRYE